MTSKLSAEREREFEQLLAFVEFYCEVAPHAQVPEGMNLRSVAEKIALEHGKSRALQGTRQAVNDIIQELSDVDIETVQAFDGALRAQGIPTLSELRQRYSSAYRAILRRNRIKTETEYYLVKELVDDLASTIPEEERLKCTDMLERYEG
jgi:hypothetical protein